MSSSIASSIASSNSSNLKHLWKTKTNLKSRLVDAAPPLTSSSCVSSPVADGFLGPSRPAAPAFTALYLLLLFDDVGLRLLFYHLHLDDSVNFASFGLLLFFFLILLMTRSHLLRTRWCSQRWYQRRSDALSWRRNRDRVSDRGSGSLGHEKFIFIILFSFFLWIILPARRHLVCILPCC